MKKKMLAVMLITTMTLSTVACGSKTKSDNADTSSTKATESTSVSSTEKKEEAKSQDIKAEDLNALSDKGIITGVKNITVEESTEIKLNELVYDDKDIVKSVDIDDSKVDYSKAGAYDVIYTITFNGDKLRDYIKDNDINVSFNTDSNTIIVKTTVTVTVATKEDTEKAIENGDTSVVTEETIEAVKNYNKSKANDNAVESTSTPVQSNASDNNNNSGSNDISDSNSDNNSAVSDNNTGNSSSNSSSSNSSSASSNSNSGSSNSSSSTSGSSNSGNNSASVEKPQSHSHNYVEVSRTEATCTTDGVITKQCSCGATITESNGSALGHDMVHHDATTHTEQKLVKEAWDETVYDERYVCNGCGAQFETNREAAIHVVAVFGDDCENYSLEKVPVDTVQHEAQYETVEVSDNNAYNECSRCGYRE